MVSGRLKRYLSTRFVDMLLYLILGLGWLLSIWLIVRLWAASQVSCLSKITWSIVLWIPFFGPLFYGALFEVPSGLGRDNIGPVDPDPTGGDSKFLD